MVGISEKQTAVQLAHLRTLQLVSNDSKMLHVPLFTYPSVARYFHYEAPQSNITTFGLELLDIFEVLRHVRHVVGGLHLPICQPMACR